MTPPCIVCVAVSGSLPRKQNNPAVPISVTEQIESTHDAFEAGAAIVHAHVRNDDETPSSDPDKFAALKEGGEQAFGQNVPWCVAGIGAHQPDCRSCEGVSVRFGLKVTYDAAIGKTRREQGEVRPQPDLCSNAAVAVKRTEGG